MNGVGGGGRPAGREAPARWHILLVAPQPFFIERGTPIAVRQLATALCDLGHRVDLLTYPLGEDVVHPGLRIRRIPRLPGVKHVPPGLSLRKLCLDVLLFARLRRLLRRGDYQVVHAVEEAVFAACLFRRRGQAVVYDMDSSIADQLVEKRSVLRPLRPLLRAGEAWAMRRADLVLPVCRALAERVRRRAPGTPLQVLEDVPQGEAAEEEDLRARYGIQGLLALYVGNLEPYQGIDLLLEALADPAAPAGLSLVIVGGDPRHREHYRRRAGQLGLAARVHLVGPRPLARLPGYLAQADILVSPRRVGVNTPMKLYSYMAAGRAILATDITSHSQVLDAGQALLVPPRAPALAAGLARLAGAPELRRRLGAAARALAQREYSREAFRRKLAGAYARLGQRPGSGS